ncbi:MAG: DUF3238 domain-containing protein, partial [Chloroflexi bacterium]|nr:DUF3238 domain-containing protein [Chloroflexota bacterium]
QQRYTYTYDAAGRLSRFAEIERQPVDYRYDAVGNRIEDDKAWYTYDANNRLTQQTAKPNWGESAQFTYDNNGNMTRRATSPEIREYSYDDENRMVYERMGRMQCGWDDCWYNYYDVDRHRYNGDGQKVHTQSNFASETGGLFIRYDGADPIADLKHTDGKPMANYYRGLGGEPVAVQNENGNTYEYLLDERKSVRWLATSRELAPTESYCGCESPQWVTNTYRYDAFGVQMGNSSGMAYNPLRYTGARYEPDNGMYLMGARYYIPQVGRFLTQDTWRGTPWTPWTQHLYSYTGNNPINFIDPTGHLPRSTFILGEDSGAGNPAVTVIIRAFIPQAVVSNPVNGEKFKGDGRGPQYEGGTHRIEMMFSITPGTTDAVLIKSAGLTVNLSTGETGRASLENVNIGGVELVDGVTRVGFYGAASDPLVSYAQPLDIFGWVGVDAHGNVAVAGVHDGAPSYEVWVKTEGDLPELIYSYESASLLTLGLPPYVVFSGEYRRPVPWRSQIARN